MAIAASHKRYACSIETSLRRFGGPSRSVLSVCERSSWRCRARSAQLSTSSISRLTYKDPAHPTGLYYHLLPSEQSSSAPRADEEPTQRWALTLLPNPPRKPTSPSILAYLRAPEDAPDAAILAAYARTYPDKVETHAQGLRTLHETLRTRVVPSDPHLAAEAYMRGSGWAHLNDARHALMPGRIATPDSILASVAFDEGKFLSNPALEPDADAGAYQVNDTYRLMTREEGFLQIQEAWLDIVRDALEEVN